MPAGGLPVLLFVLALFGMLWAFGVPFKERFGGLSGYYKLLFIPALHPAFLPPRSAPDG